jgi:hypothetical protein
VGDHEHSFLRAADGSYIEIAHAGDGIDTQVEGINARGEIVGNWTPAGVEALFAGHAFYRALDGTITDLSYSGFRTFAAKINASGTIVGFYEEIPGEMSSWRGFVAKRSEIVP